MNKIIPKLFVTIFSIILIVFSTIYFSSDTSSSQIEELYLSNIEKLENSKNLSYGQMKKLSKLDRPNLAFLQDYEMTMDPALGYPPIERRMTAFNDIQNRLKSKKEEYAAISNVQWQERGPGNVGGRTRALMFDPNDGTSKKVWAGAIGGGLWYNNDITISYSQWQSVGDLMANMAISTLAYDPTNTQIFYMGTGLGYTSDIQGDGIFKSTDGGANWTQLTSTSPNSNFYFVQKIAVTVQGTVLATTRIGTYRSTDGGDSWTEVQSGRMGDIEIASDNDIYITQGISTTGKVFKSTDDGQTFTDITPANGGQRIEIASAPSNADVLYAVADGGSGSTDVAWFMKSTDGGATWEDVVIPNYVAQDCSISTDHFTRGQAFFDLILAVHPENENIAIIGGIDLHKSVDGGLSWQGVSYWTGGNCDDYVHADQHAIQFRPGFPNGAIFGNDGGISYSSDVGNSNNPEFGDRNNGYNVTTFYAAAARNELNSNYFLAGAQDNGTQQFTEAGFGDTREATGGDGGYCFIDQDNGDIQVTSYVGNSYRLSQDGGLSFTSISDDQNVGRFINPTEYDNDTDILYGAGGVDQYTRYDDISGTPSAMQTITTDFDGKQITTIKASPYTANRIFVGVRVTGGEGELFIVDDANTAAPTVTNITGAYSGSHGEWISSIDVGATDNQLLATFSNYGVSSVYETMDGGTNWTDKNDNLPDIPVRYGLYNPVNRNQVLLATELGVWSTNDISATPNWEPTNAGLANVRCDMLKYRTADQLVVVATYGRGLFTSNVFATTVDADFKTNQIVGYVGVPVQFNDASLLPNGDWSWNFGDGSGTSTAQNPAYTYNMAGTYDISLAIDGGASTETKTGFVTILPVKATPYLAADGGDFETNPNDFTSRALLNGINHWERGTPTNQITTLASGANAWKTDLDADIDDKGFDYISALYTPAYDLTNTNKNYIVKFRKSLSTVFCNGPQALQLQYSVDGGNSWIRLGSSIEEFGSINWYNRGDNTGCSIDQSIFPDKVGWNASNVDGGTDNTVHNENTEFNLSHLVGEANVSFRFVSSVSSGFSEAAYNGDGFMIDDFEIITSEANAGFDADVTTAFIGQNVKFTSRSSGIDTYSWNFGDGSATSAEANPSHSYSAAGTYTVSLSITSAAGDATETKTDYMFILPKKGSSYTLAEGGDFETNTTDFGVQHIAGTSFELGKSSVAGKDGTASGENAWVTGISETEYADESESRLVTPSFDFSILGQYALEFKSKFQFEDEWDGFIVEYSIDLGTTWTKLNPVQEDGWYTTISDPSSVFGASVPIFSGNTAGAFTTFTTDVSDLAGNANVVFRIVFMSDANTVDAGMALDDFILTGPQTGPATAGFTFTEGDGCDEQIITFTNTSTGAISALDWDFGANATPTTAEGFGPFDVTYVGTGKSTVTLTVEGVENGIQVETKADIVSTAPHHTPTFTEEAVAGNDAQRNLVASTGDTYQWYINNEIIEGAVNQTYVASETATYAVEVDVDGCLGKSDNTRLITALLDDYFGNSVFVYPNPASEKIVVDVSNEFKGEVELKVHNLNGALFFNSVENKQTSGFLKEINVSNFNRGIYFVELQFGNKKEIRKIIIK